MRRLALVHASVLLAAFACARAAADLPPPEPAPQPEVFVEARPLTCDGEWVAIIGDRGIPIAAFDHIYELKLLKYQDRGRELPQTADRRYRQSISERVIHQELLALEAAKLSLDYDRAALEEREQAQKRGITDWEEHLRRRGESEASLRDLYIAELRERAILETSGALTLGDDEVFAEYQTIKPNYVADAPRIHAAHILIEVEEGISDADALARAEEAYQRVIQPGADFAKLAEELSDGPSARKGGDLGIFPADRMVEEFSKAAFALEPGEVSRPVRTRFGYHVIKVYGAWGPGELPLDALEAQIRERLAARKLHAGRRELKARLFEEHAPINCVQQMDEILGRSWDPPKRSSDSETIEIMAP